MATTPTAVDHGITITEVHLPAGTPLQASCLCGWQSPIVPSRPRAVAEGQSHTAEVCSGTQTSGVSSLDTPYLDQVAQAVAERICTRGVVLSVDELATIAMALDCRASDLLPPYVATGSIRVSR